MASPFSWLEFTGTLLIHGLQRWSGRALLHQGQLLF